MSYDEVIDAYFTPTPDGVVPAPTADPSPARRLRDAMEPLAMHAVWCRPTSDALGALGLGFLDGYLWGRAAALGEPAPGVVVSSFAVFEAGLITATYAQARATVDRDTMLAARTSATVASLTDILADVPAADLEAAADALQAAVSAPHGVGKPLFSGLSSQPWPDTVVGRLWHACERAREHRGDSHVAVCVQRGLGPIEMSILTELWVGYPVGAYSGTRGFSPEAIAGAAAGLAECGLMVGDELSDDGRRFRAAIEDDTDDLDRVVVEALGADADRVIAWLDHWSSLCVAARAFPPDARKRAAG